ncbi:MAG: DUF4251 domain-containing protein [Bacteroidaceae bacterium]|nr:DUF4251 domain-containing protein [Bacteroidaceae bacterium]
MKKIYYLTILLGLLCSGVAYAQSYRADCKKLCRTEREKAWRMERLRRRAEARAIEQHQDSVAFKAALAALKEGSWVLEANNINFSNGVTRFVSSGTNYVSCNEGEGVIQTAYANFAYSPNGLGGVTVQGDISGVNISMDRDGNVYYNFNIQGSAVSATVSLTLTVGTNQASAMVNPNFSGQSITFDGYLVPYSQSAVFQGMTQW